MTAGKAGQTITMELEEAYSQPEPDEMVETEPEQSTEGESTDEPDDDIDQMQTDKEFVGSESCQTCHTEKYNDWIASGHPYKFTITDGSTGPVYPIEADNFQSDW